jgi:hypothetical protein
MKDNEETPFGKVKNLHPCILCKYKGECKIIVHKYCVDRLGPDQYFV